MATHHVGLELVAHADGGNHAVQEHCGLCHTGLLQLLSGSLEHDIRDAETKYVVCLLKELPCSLVVLIQFFAHSSELGTLTREYKCFHSTLFIYRFKIFRLQRYALSR